MAVPHEVFGVRGQSEAATPLSDGVRGSICPARFRPRKSGVALRFPPQSKTLQSYLAGTSRPRPYKVPGYPYVPWVFIVFSVVYLDLTIYNDVGAYRAAVAAGQPALLNTVFGTALVLVGRGKHEESLTSATKAVNQLFALSHAV